MDEGESLRSSSAHSDVGSIQDIMDNCKVTTGLSHIATKMPSACHLCLTSCIVMPHN